MLPCVHIHTHAHIQAAFLHVNTYIHTLLHACVTTHMNKLIHTKEWAYNNNTHNHDECIYIYIYIQTHSHICVLTQLYMDIHKPTQK